MVLKPFFKNFLCSGPKEAEKKDNVSHSSFGKNEVYFYFSHGLLI